MAKSHCVTPRSYLNQNHVQLVKVGLLLLKGLWLGTETEGTVNGSPPGNLGSQLKCSPGFNDEPNNVLLDAVALVSRQNSPPGLDDALKNLQGKVLCLLVVGELEDGVDLRAVEDQFANVQKGIARPRATLPLSKPRGAPLAS